MPQGKGTYGSQVGRPRENYMTAGPIVSTEPSYKEKMSSFLDGLQDFFINDERRAERQMYTSGRRQERRENRQERRNIRQAKRAGRRDLETIDASGPRRMEQPQFKQDRQAIFDENVQALQETASRKANATGGEMKREQYEEGGEMDDQMNALAISVLLLKLKNKKHTQCQMVL